MFNEKLSAEGNLRSKTCLPGVCWLKVWFGRRICSDLSVLTKSVLKTVGNNAQYDCSVLWRAHIAFSAHVRATYIANNSLKWVRRAGGVRSQLYWVPAKCHTTWNRLNQRNVFHNVKIRDQGYVSERVILNRKLGDHDRFGYLIVNQGLTLWRLTTYIWVVPHR